MDNPFQGTTSWHITPNLTVKLMRPGGRVACVVASFTASRRLQFATPFFERQRRQPPRRCGFGTRDWPCTLH
jgi:hypothetical protein